jgi:hypothetical protein
MTSVRRGKADVAAASAISRSILSWAAHHPIPCTTRIVNAALDIALALSRMLASGPLKTLIDEFAVIADDSANHATLAAGVCTDRRARHRRCPPIGGATPTSPTC